jgi:two-component system, OmpR family, copper resistance phosphate regulon response regulator CusR
MPRILIVEDQAKLRRNLQEFLEREGYEVDSAGTGEEGYRLAKGDSFDAIVLDLTLPRKDGMDVLKDLRAENIVTPVIILTARDSVEQRVQGLEEGADDYIAKPFSHAELLARLRAVLRRSGTTADHRLQACDLEIDLLSREVRRADVDIELSQREFDLLEYLVRHKNTEVSREAIARDVWKEPAGLLTNAIDVCMNGLRKKIQHPGAEPIIETVRGVGFTIRDHA